MRIQTLFWYLLGRRDAILEIAADRPIIGQFLARIPEGDSWLQNLSEKVPERVEKLQKYVRAAEAQQRKGEERFKALP